MNKEFILLALDFFKRNNAVALIESDFNSSINEVDAMKSIKEFESQFKEELSKAFPNKKYTESVCSRGVLVLRGIYE